MKSIACILSFFKRRLIFENTRVFDFKGCILLTYAFPGMKYVMTGIFQQMMLYSGLASTKWYLTHQMECGFKMQKYLFGFSSQMTF